MTKVYGLLFLLCVSVAGFAQGSDTTASGGLIATKGNSLILPASTVIAYSAGGPITTGNLGILNINTPPVASGTLMAGATFGTGGAFSVSLPQNPQTGFAGFEWQGTFSTGATWEKVTLANRTTVYTLSANIVNATNGHTGAFVLQTSTLPPSGYTGVAPVLSVSMHLN